MPTPDDPPGSDVKILRREPIAFLRAVIDKYLGTLFLSPDEFRRYIDHNLPLPDSAPTFYGDLTFKRQVDPSSLDARLVSWSMQEGAPHIHIVANVWPYTSTSPMLVLVTDTSDVLFALKSDVGMHPDGTVQIYGAEPGLCLVTPKQAKEQYSRTIFRGTQSMKQLQLQKRQPDGSWQTTPLDIV